MIHIIQTKYYEKASSQYNRKWYSVLCGARIEYDYLRFVAYLDNSRVPTMQVYDGKKFYLEDVVDAGKICPTCALLALEEHRVEQDG